MPVLIVIGLIFSFSYNKKASLDFILNEKQVNAPAEIVTSLSKDETQNVLKFVAENYHKDNKETDLEKLLSSFEDNETEYQQVVTSLPVSDAVKFESGFSLFKHKIPLWIFFITLIGLTIWSWRQNLSLIPLLGLICCLYMMAELSIWNWIYFTIWLLIGLGIYFGYSRKNSKLNIPATSDFENA